MSELPVFEEGDGIYINDWVYEVTQVDWTTKDKPLQYRLEALDGPEARLEPKHESGIFVLATYNEVRPEEITH